MRFRNGTLYDGRSLKAIWLRVMDDSIRCTRQNERDAAITREKHSTLTRLGGRVPDVLTAFEVRAKHLREADVEVSYDDRGGFSGNITTFGAVIRLPKQQLDTVRLVRRVRALMWNRLLDDPKQLPAAITEASWGSVHAAAQRFADLVDRYGENMSEHTPAGKRPRNTREKLVDKLTSLDVREKAWRTKAKRAATALKGIEQERKRAARKLASYDAARQAEAVLAEARS